MIKVSTPEQVGQLGRFCRKQQGMGQDEFGLSQGTSHVSVGNFEKGAKGVALSKALDLLQALGVEVYLDVPEEVKNSEKWAGLLVALELTDE